VRSQGALRSYYERDSLGRLLRSRVRVAVTSLEPSAEPRGANIERHYEYDRAGQLLAVDDARVGRTRYRYDAAGRLLWADAPHARETFAFDPAAISSIRTRQRKPMARAPSVCGPKRNGRPTLPNTSTILTSMRC
jgi:YD repeat-containing protein